MSERGEADQRTDEATEVADDDLPDEAKAVVHGPEGQAGAAGAGAPNDGVTGGEADAPES